MVLRSGPDAWILGADSPTLQGEPSEPDVRSTMPPSTLKERKDYRNIIAAMCRFGCDDLYEKRYLYVDGGVIRLNTKKSRTRDLEDAICTLEGSHCHAWSDGNQGYFEWHRRQALGKTVQ